MDKDKLVEYVNKGFSHREIAELLGCTRSAVSVAAKKLGLIPAKQKPIISIEALKSAVAFGVSFSAFAVEHGHTLQSICKVAKKYNIKPPGTNHLEKELPLDDIIDEYKSGMSLNKLHLRYNVPIALLKRKFKKNGVKIRSYDDAIRPTVLNDRDTLKEMSTIKSYRTIAKELGVKTKTVTDAAKKLNLDFPFVKKWDKIEISTLVDYYLEQSKTPSQIAIILGYPYSVVLRRIKELGLPVDQPGGKLRPSKYPELNDMEWLQTEYLNRSAGDIAEEIGCPIAMVIYYLHKYGIIIRSKKQYLELMLKNVHGIKSEKHGIICHSKLEKNFLDTISANSSINRDIKLESCGSYCFIDFEIDNLLYEIKPKDVLTVDGINRSRMIKQYKICEKNNRDLIVWTPKGVWDGIITDSDRYHAANWKLMFESSEQCVEWLLKYGFISPKYYLLDLANSAAKMAHCKIGHELNADYNNHHHARLTKHFFPHFWRSTHNNYIPISAAWEAGNINVLRNAVSRLWENGKEVNIYGLVKYIAKFFKDFTTVSIFKPWIASYIYDRYLPNGGTIIDPSCGWGGRFMATVGKNLKYVGYDLNGLSVESHKNLRGFLGNRVNIEPEFHQSDSSVCDFVQGDLLFTSPPYDNTELYYGVDSHKTKTVSIIDNIVRKFNGLIVLNVPKRQEEMVRTIASNYDRVIIDRLEMKTSSFMGREKTFEPILVISAK